MVIFRRLKGNISGLRGILGLKIRHETLGGFNASGVDLRPGMFISGLENKYEA